MKKEKPSELWGPRDNERTDAEREAKIETDAWKARAERAEAALASSDWARQVEVYCRATRLKWAKNALRYRQYAGDLRDGLRAVGETADIHRKRAERAEALIREADMNGWRHRLTCFGEEGCRCGLNTWRAKVRDLLEGGNDKG